jgi:hypothetical protein
MTGRRALTDKEREALAKAETRLREREAKHQEWITKARAEFAELAREIGTAKFAEFKGIAYSAADMRLRNLEGQRKGRDRSKKPEGVKTESR